MTTSTRPMPKHPLHEQPLGDGLKYLRALVMRFPGTIQFETGAGHIVHDLLARLPTVPELEKQKTALCNTIVEMAHPLSACMFAEGMNMVITATPDPLSPPRILDGLCTYTAFDLESATMRHYFIAAPHDDSYIAALTINSGLAVLCEPRNYDAIHFHENRNPPHRPEVPIWRWTETTIARWYDSKGKNFIATRLQLQSSALTDAQVLGITDTAQMATLASQIHAPTDIVNRQTSATAKSISAFAHEAGFAETASQPGSAASRQTALRATQQQQAARQPPTDPRTGTALPAGVNPNTVLPHDPRTGKLMPVGILDPKTAQAIDPQTGKLLPGGVTNPLLAVPADPNAADTQPKDAHGHVHHHGPDTKPDVN